MILKLKLENCEPNQNYTAFKYFRIFKNVFDKPINIKGAPKIIQVTINPSGWKIRGQCGAKNQIFLNSNLVFNMFNYTDLVDVFEALCHEIAHCIQYNSGVLKTKHGTKTHIWKNRKYDLSCYVGRPPFNNYRNWPWENQARDMSKQLFEKHFKSLIL